MPKSLSFFNVKYSLFCLVSIGILSLLPGNQFPQTDIQYADLMVHIGMYAILTKIVLWEFSQFLTINWRYLIVIVLALIMYGALMEILQENLIEGRFGSWADFIANGLGCLFMLVLNVKLIKN